MAPSPSPIDACARSNSPICFDPPYRSSVAGSLVALWFSGHGLNAYQLEPQTAYAIEDAVELGLIYDLSREDRLSAFRLHLHPFESNSKSLAELVTHHYPIDRPGARAG